MRNVIRQQIKEYTLDGARLSLMGTVLILRSRGNKLLKGKARNKVKLKEQVTLHLEFLQAIEERLKELGDPPGDGDFSYEYNYQKYKGVL